MTLLPSHPILDCATAATYEKEVLGEDEREWSAMKRAGVAIARAVPSELATGGTPLAGASLLVLVGKGHNGGDALLAAAEMRRMQPDVSIEVVFVFGERALRPLAARAWQQLQQQASDVRVQRRFEELSRHYTIILDGVFGFQFRAPLQGPALRWLENIAPLDAALRVAVDLPSGLGEAGAFQADVTLATGILKRPLLGLSNAGRIRYLDLGFFEDLTEDSNDRVLLPALLRNLRRLRPAQSDKRSFGHLCVIGGSGSFPGAVMMSVQAAVRSGAGLVSAFVPESLAPAFAAACPEAMWTGCPETPSGALALDTVSIVRERLDRADAVLVGPGMGRETETLAFVKDLMRLTSLPLVLDADALQPDIVWSGSGPRILTPHAGEYARISNGAELGDFRPTRGSVTVLKGPVTRVSDGNGVVYHSFEGGPVLARGGSGDMLAGLIGALVARGMASFVRSGRGAPVPSEELYAELLAAAASGVLWHGRAASLLAAARGETAVRATELLDYLSPALAST